MSRQTVLLVLALVACGCDDAVQRELEIASLGEPRNDVEHIEVAYARAEQVDERLTAIDRLILRDDPSLTKLERVTEDLDAMIAKAGDTSSSPGALSSAARDAAFDTSGEFRGDRSQMFDTVHEIELWADNAISARDDEREFWLMMGGCLAAPAVFALSLLVAVRIRRRLRKPGPRLST